MTLWRHRRTTAPQPNDNNWLIEHLKSNFISSISFLVTSFGLTMIYAYHFHIEYFPLIGIDSFTSIIFATSYVGVILLISFGVVLFVPALFIGSVWQEANKKNNPTQQQQRQHLVTLHGVALLSFAIWMVVYFLFEKSNISPGYTLLLPILICLLITFLCRFLWILKNESLGKAMKWCADPGEVLTFVFTNISILFLQICPMLMLALIILGSSDKATSTSDYIVLLERLLLCYLFLLALGVYFIVAWFDTPPRKLHRASAIAAMFIFPMVVSFFFENISLFPATIARLTKVGNFYASELTLSPAGCAVLAKQGVLSCPDKDGEPMKLCGAYVMSRFGSEAYLKVNFNQADKLAAIAAKNTSETKNTPKNDIKLENVYLPTAAILGMKVDSAARATNIAQIDKYLKERPSICPIEKAALQTSPYSFKATELFSRDQSMLSSEGKKKLDALVKLITDNKKPIALISIAGHTDQTGGSHYNLLLSQMRALAVDDYLKKNLSHDIAPRLFHSQGYGNTRPKKTPADCPKHWPASKQLDCFAENRRVEIEVSLQ